MTSSRGLTVITGASSGLGAEMVRTFAGRGERVVALARRVELLEELRTELSGASGEVIVFFCDVADRPQLQSVFSKIRSLGSIERLVLNAGIDGHMPGTAFNQEIVDRLFAVNFLGACACIQEALPEMVKLNKGHIVGISSLAGSRGLPAAGPYSASKAAMTVMLESLRIDLRSTGVDVTVVHPGFIKTAIIEGAKHPMPFLMELEDGTAAIVRAIDRRRKSAAFPLLLAFAVWLGKLVPSRLYDWGVSLSRPNVP